MISPSRLHYHVDRSVRELPDRIESICAEYTTYREAADAAALPIRTLHRYRTGEARPNFRELVKMATGWHTSLDWLVLGRGLPQPE